MTLRRSRGRKQSILSSMFHFKSAIYGDLLCFAASIIITLPE
jgi:hypothetical protein